MENLDTIGANGGLAGTALEGIFNDLPKTSLGIRYGRALLEFGVNSIADTFMVELVMN